MTLLTVLPRSRTDNLKGRGATLTFPKRLSSLEVAAPNRTAPALRGWLVESGAVPDPAMDLSIGVVSRLSRKGVFRCSLGNAGDIESDCCRSKPISILATRPRMDHVSQARRLHDGAPRDLSRDDPGLEILGQIRPGP